KSFYNEAKKQGLTPDQLSDLLSSISELPGTTAQELLDDLKELADDPLLSSLKSSNLRQEGIRSAAGVYKWLLNNRDKNKYPEDQIFKAASELIVANDVPADKIIPHESKGRMVLAWIIPVIVAAGLILFFILFRRKKKDDKGKTGKH
ncbi:MAG TPA: hypothetical protein VHO68_09360, partial [Bacteroidales bacterium]|nr:hypothetical protein [Bacteroidales bacterium]